jgi:sulfate adenylyltransferase subunit 1 (EFTu-like GTPase family)
MKMTKFNEAEQDNTAVSLKRISTVLQDKLEDLTLGEALQQGIIDELGDENGDFIFYREDIDKSYAIIQGQAVWMSDAAAEAAKDKTVKLSQLTFHTGISEIEGPGLNKKYFVLGMPKGIKGGEVVRTLAAEPVDTKKN